MRVFYVVCAFVYGCFLTDKVKNLIEILAICPCNSYNLKR